MRYISLTEEMKQDALRQFTEMLQNQRSSDTSIKFSLDLKNKTEDAKVIINFTTLAWLKMWSLVHTEKGEIGWHGIVEKVNKGMYIIKDILMYPQYVTGATVQTDDVGYGNWLHKELEDDQINNLRFHGHSHVNMGTTPSGVDTTWYNEILQGLEPNDFYIFGIFNKREDFFIEIYDLAENTIYEKSDITMNVILDDGNYLNNWTELTKKKNLKERPKEKTFLDKYYSTPKQTKEENKEEDEEEVDFETLIIELTKEDFKDEALKREVLKEINRRYYHNNYFNVAYGRWFQLTDNQKIEAAQKYYTSKAQKAADNIRVSEMLEAQKNFYDRYGYGGYYYD